jgi:hypothetical protein
MIKSLFPAPQIQIPADSLKIDDRIIVSCSPNSNSNFPQIQIQIFPKFKTPPTLSKLMIKLLFFVPQIQIPANSLKIDNPIIVFCNPNSNPCRLSQN